MTVSTTHNLSENDWGFKHSGSSNCHEILSGLSETSFILVVVDQVFGASFDNHPGTIFSSMSSVQISPFLDLNGETSWHDFHDSHGDRVMSVETWCTHDHDWINIGLAKLDSYKIVI